MNATTTTKHNIRNPEKWVGKYVRHMANWRDFQWGDADPRYVVCEWTGKLILIVDEQQPEFEDYELLNQFKWFSPCYYYCGEAIMDMVKYAQTQLAA